MPTTTNVKQIKLHRMTKSQYDSATKNANEFYVTKDEAIDYNDLVNTPDLATVATSGSYNDLSNKPTIPAAQVNSDWNANSGVAQILNKPTLATVATSGSYRDLTNKPTINNLTTSAQQAAINSGITSALVTQITTNKNDITTINGKIPSAATSSNQLADKAFVNSSINALAAFYITSSAAGAAFASKAALDAGPYYSDGQLRTPTKNDYAIVSSDETHDNACTRYSYTGSQWAFQYVVNDTPFTQAQLDAINSGITSSKVGNYDTHIADTTIHVTTSDKNNWNAKQAAITGAATTVTTDNLTASRVLISNSSGKIAASSSVTTTELGYLDGVTSAIQTQLNGKQATLVSGTNIKTVNGTTLLGSGDLSTYPSQSGNSGKFLTTNGSAVSWATVDALPSQSGNSGKFLTTNGTAASWASLATVATSGSYNDLSNKLTAGTGISITNNAISTDRTIVTFVEWS